SSAGVAVVHSLFNIVACIIFLPFSQVFVKLVYLTIPEKEEPVVLSAEEQELRSLDVRFLDTPGLALSHAKKAVLSMAQIAKKSIDYSMELLKVYDEEKAAEVVRLESEVDKFEDELGSYLMKISSRDLSEKESQTLSMLLHCIGDFERISDHALNLKEAADEIYDKKLEFSDKASEELNVFTSAVQDIMGLAIEVLDKEDAHLALLVEPLEEVIDQLNADIKKRHVKRLRKGKCTIEMGFVLSDITTNLERVSDHCSNVAVSLLQGEEEGFEAHEYKDALKTEDNVDFQGRVLAYRSKYILP
ncbi:MAG: Na/Pi cotransporter family protein, partial [Lachnospiraceae bacterium]|nr:Na/Pi cotransporter family protein [Lachnospiraceae bacterium]